MMSATAVPPQVSPKGFLKRLLVGRQVATQRLEHTLLPKVLALPLFSSDAMSSVIYAPEEILIPLLVASAAAAYLAMPIAIAIAVLLAVVVASYRQVIKAYPSGGGAYIVSKDNLGAAPGLVAAAALIVDYILTVAVQIAAGVYAITSAVPKLLPFSVELSVGFVLFIMLVNLRGAKESGAFFAPPVYLFIVSILVMVGVGVSKCLLGTCPDAASQDLPALARLAAVAKPVSIFVILKAFSSGCAALTGVEAVSNGVRVFKRPQARNAAMTLTIMGSLAIVMFLGIAFLAARAHVTISEERSVVAQVAFAVFHGGVGFYLVQIFSAAILMLGANTSFQGFPQLASILANDRYMPRQFVNRGDRLVFSNGIIALALVACALIVWAQADVNRLIQLYVVGVFTAFTMSQTGMVKHWLRERRKGGEGAAGWQRSIVFNAVGAVTTFVVVIVVTLSKFLEGAWISILGMAILAVTFSMIYRHYAAVAKALNRGRVRITDQIGVNRVVLLVHDFNPALMEALGYIRSFRPPEFHAVWTGRGRPPPDARERWREYCFAGGPELEVLEGRSRLLESLLAYLRSIRRDRPDFITVVIPEVVRERLSAYVLTHLALIRVKAGLVREPNVVITDVPVPAGDASPPSMDGRPVVPNRVEALLFVSGINDATIRAVNYARTLQAASTRAIHFALDPAATRDILDKWARQGSPIPLEVSEAPFRDLTAPMLEAVHRVTDRPGTIAAVVIPEYVVKRRHMILHNQSALFVKRLFLAEPRAILTSVPWAIDM